MPLVANQTKEIDLASPEYWEIQSLTDGSTTLSAGEVVKVGNVSGFTLTDVAINTLFTLIIKTGKARATKAAEAITAGDKIFWDDGNKVVTKTDGGSYPVLGYAVESALLADATVLMTFDGRDVAAY